MIIPVIIYICVILYGLYLQDMILGIYIINGATHKEKGPEFINPISTVFPTYTYR